jgi:predicted amidohydrolase YtcJ
LLSACSSQTAITPAPTTDPEQQILFYNGVILTMDPEMPEGTAAAAHGEKISAVGGDEEILALIEER